MTEAASDHQAFQLLYVDDEAQALKYFPKMFPEFRVLTAGGVTAARDIIDNIGDTIAVVISDQRMPDGSGTDLLAYLRKRRPDIVRILTTAYSDLESAIAAVNTGEVYRYVVKPWEQDELRQTLMRAYELFQLQQERDWMLKEKIAVLQRMILMDRVRSYGVLAAGLANRVKHPMQALKAYLDAAPPSAEPGGDRKWGELWAMAHRESQRVLDTVQNVVARTIEPTYHFVPVDAAAILREALAKPVADATRRGVAIAVETAAGLPPIRADAAMLRQMFQILPERLLLCDPKARKIRIRLAPGEVWGQPGVRLSVTADDRDWSGIQLNACFAMLSELPDSPGAATGEGDLLAAYFIAYHHGGTLAIHRTTPTGPGFVAGLPAEPEQVRIPGIDQQWLERTFTCFEA